MKQFLSIIFIASFGFHAVSQQLVLNVQGKNPFETAVIDSVSYLKIHADAKSVAGEISSLSDKLSRKGFIEHQVSQQEKPNDSTFLYRFDLGKRFRSVHVYIGSVSKLLTFADRDIENDTVIIPYQEIESFLNASLGQMERKGFALAKLQLINIRPKGNYLIADLSFIAGNKRELDGIVINGYPKFPEGHKRAIIRTYRGRVFNRDNLQKVYDDFNKFRFVKQVKYPEILFTSDSTKVYAYLEKSKANSFDGFIGFANDDKQKIVFTGYVDLALNNILNTGESFTVYWKSDGQEQKTFNAGIGLPYIFKSRFGVKAQLNIFKQDSTFQNTKTALDLGYFLDYNKRIYVGYQSTESSDIRNLNSASISDFKSAFATLSFELAELNNDDFLFPERTQLAAKIGAGSRNAKAGSDRQFFGSLDIAHNFYLNKKNIINVRSQDFYLGSDSYIINELYRFGGINSIRGFNESSLQGSFFSSVLTEYRLLLNPAIYIHTITDYGYFKDNATSNGGSLLGLGFGVGLLTKTGLFNLIYANGSTGDQAIKLSNSIVHISFKARF